MHDHPAGDPSRDLESVFSLDYADQDSWISSEDHTFDKEVVIENDVSVILTWSHDEEDLSRN